MITLILYMLGTLGVVLCAKAKGRSGLKWGIGSLFLSPFILLVAIHFIKDLSDNSLSEEEKKELEENLKVTSGDAPLYSFIGIFDTLHVFSDRVVISPTSKVSKTSSFSVQFADVRKLSIKTPNVFSSGHILFATDEFPTEKLGALAVIKAPNAVQYSDVQKKHVKQMLHFLMAKTSGAEPKTVSETSEQEADATFSTDSTKLVA